MFKILIQPDVGTSYLKGNITISSPHMIFMKLPMLQDNCIPGLKSI